MAKPTISMICSRCKYEHQTKYCSTCIWWQFIDEELTKPYFQELDKFVKQQRQSKEIYPSAENVFNAFTICNYWDLKVIILGGEPDSYPGNAHGLAFSTLKQEMGFILSNIFREVKNDIYPEFINHNSPIFKTNNLTQWAKQGILLLNILLTVEKEKSLSHRGKGWEQFTQNTLKFLNEHPRRLVYMLWGKNALSYKGFIDGEKHLILEAAHPSPHTAQNGFFGCKHFSQANEFILKTQNKTIGWHLLN